MAGGPLRPASCRSGSSCRRFRRAIPWRATVPVCWHYGRLICPEQHPERYPERGMPESWATAAGIALDHTADVPLGVQLDWVVRAAVASGRLRAGDRLPGLREVADQLGVNHNTVRAAVAKLEADGLLETRHGSGTFVAADVATQVRQAALLDEIAQRAQDAGIAPRELAAALYVAEPSSDRASEDQAAVERRTLRQDLAV